MKSRSLAVAVAMLVVATLSPMTSTPVDAATIVGIAISNDGVLVDNLGWNLGYSFVADNPVNVVSLGVWDDHEDGLLSRHEVGLWTSAGVLLASDFVPSGGLGILDTGFRFVNIAPVPLTVGQTYYVAATFHGPGDDLWTADPSSMVVAPQITYDSRRFEFGSTLVFPGQAGSNATGYWGGNVRLDGAPVPEPSTMLLLGGGLGLLAKARRRKNEKS